MPITYEVREESKLVLSTYTGAVSTTELLAHVRALGADSRIGPGYRALADMRRIEGGTVTLNGMLAVVDELGRTGGRLAAVPLAIVAPHDGVYGMSRTYAMLSEEQRVRVQVFRSVQDAWLWLGSGGDPDGLVESDPPV